MQKHYRPIFSKLLRSSYRDVKGICSIDSKQEGPCVGITICTHGNEPCGLAIAQYILAGSLQLKRGKIIIVMNNPAACQKYFNAQTEKEKQNARFIDINMNRLPVDLKNPDFKDLYEVKRALELLPIWQEFDYAIDIHSTTQPSEAMIIEGEKDASEFTIKMNVPIVIRNMVPVQVGAPAISFYDENCICFGLEAGSHETEEAQNVAVDCTINLLHQLDMLSISYNAKMVQQSIYTVENSILFPDNTYVLSREFPMFGNVYKGEIIASGQGEDITSSIDGCTIMAPKGLTPYNIKEEVLFICHKS